ncbi:hypothetical protein, partial [Photobacterium damselae]|uniref:hypothetical protein n=1 Tax=Photobacterium damselae TaxID=38293 RepID=UPI002F3E604B
MKDSVFSQIIEQYPIFYYIYLFVLGILALSVLLNLIFSITLRILTLNKRDDIYKYYVENSPTIYKPWLNIKFGSWLRSIDVPFLHWRFFKVFYKMTKKDVLEWRNVVKISFGKYYFLYLGRIITNKIILIIAVP